MSRRSTQDRESIFRGLRNTMCCAPAIVIAVSDDGDSHALKSVALAMEQREPADADREVEFSQVVIEDVPVAFLSNGCAYHFAKVYDGSRGVLFWMDVDTDNYRGTGGFARPNREVTHSLNNCFFVPFEFADSRKIDTVDGVAGFASINGKSGAWLEKGEDDYILNLFSGEVVKIDAPDIMMNGVLISSINPFEGEPLPRGGGGPEKEVRRECPD